MEMRKYGNSNKQEYMHGNKNTHLKMVTTHFTTVTELRNNQHVMHRSTFSLASSKMPVLFDIC